MAEEKVAVTEVAVTVGGWEAQEAQEATSAVAVMVEEVRELVQ